MQKYILWITRILTVAAVSVSLVVVFDDPTKLPAVIPFGIGIFLFCTIIELFFSKKGAKIRIAFGNITLVKTKNGQNILTLIIVIICLIIIFLKYVLKLF